MRLSIFTFFLFSLFTNLFSQKTYKTIDRLHSEGKTDSLLEYLHTLIQDKSTKELDKGRYRLIEAEIYIEKGNFELAKSYLFNLEKTSTNISHFVWSTLGNLYYQTNQKDSALFYCNKIRDFNAEASGIKFIKLQNRNLMVLILMDKNDYLGALKLGLELVEMYKMQKFEDQLPLILTKVAKCYQKLNQSKEAISTAKSALMYAQKHNVANYIEMSLVVLKELHYQNKFFQEAFNYGEELNQFNNKINSENQKKIKQYD